MERMSLAAVLLRRQRVACSSLSRRVTCKRGLATSTTTLKAPALSVVPATNLGLGSWQEASNRGPRIFSSLASEEEDDQDLPIDMDSLCSLARQNCTPLRLEDMYKYGSSKDPQQRLRNAQFLHNELQIRIAQRAIDLLTLPHGLNEAPPIVRVAHIYLKYLDRIQQQMSRAPQTTEEEVEFTNMLESFVLDRTAIPTAIAQGVAHWRYSSPNENNVNEMEEALYRFFTARVGLRFLCEHHVWSRADSTEMQNERGCIQTNCDIEKEISDVVQQVREQTKECHGVAPEFEIVDCSSEKYHDFTYAPHHLQYMVMELLKNSSRSTVQRHLELKQEKMPPIRIVVARGAEDVTIKVADGGGGVPRSTMDRIWSFSHTTSDAFESQTPFGSNPLLGISQKGFGLPLARIYARYFGGELTLKSTEGYGLDAYLYLPRLGRACENLPPRVNASPGAQDSNPQQDDSNPQH